jgi:hypothetical protein
MSMSAFFLITETLGAESHPIIADAHWCFEHLGEATQTMVRPR